MYGPVPADLEHASFSPNAGPSDKKTPVSIKAAASERKKGDSLRTS